MKSVTFLGVLFLSAFPCSAAMYGISPESGDFVQQSLFEKDSCRVGDTAPDGIVAFSKAKGEQAEKRGWC